jgi:outer membrane usher protein
MSRASARLLPLLVLLVVCVAGPAAAQDQRAFLDVTVNGVSKGDTLVVLRGDDALVGVDMLTQAGLHGFEGRRETIGSDAFVSLASLAPRVTFTFSEADLRLTLTVHPDLLGVTVKDMQSREPAGLVYRSAPSGFVNYAVSGSGRENYDVFTESALSAKGVLFYNTASVTPRGAVRGITSMTMDDRRHLRRWVAGDAFAGGMPLGGDALLTGIAVSKEFSLAPYFVRHPMLSLSTPIATPSTVEVRVNGRLVRTEQVQPGRLDLQSLPLTTGHNNTQILVRDPFGGERELSTSYYLATSVLARGVQDYRYAFGWRRASTSSSWDYAAPAMFARHRVGVTNWLTAGYRMEAERGLTNGGSILNFRLPLGEIEAATSVSRSSGQALGTAAQLSYMFVGGPTGIGASLREASRTYNVIGAPPGSAALRELTVFGSLPIPGTSGINLQHSRSLGEVRSGEQRTSLSGSVRVTRGANLTAALTRSVSKGVPHMEASVGVTMTLGRDAVVSTSTVRGPDSTYAAVDLQKSLPVGTGFGYQLHGESGLRNATSGAIQYQGQYGRYDLRQEVSNGVSRPNLSVSGALVGIGGGIYATRPVRNSFALVRVPGVNGVRTYSSHQEIGRTNKRGDLLIPDLLPYYGNQVNISDSDIPLDFVVPDVQITLAPPYRGGAVVLFPVRRIQRVTGAVLLTGSAGDQKPTYGELTIVAAGERIVSPLGVDGEFYFENLPEGRHEATVKTENRSCVFILNVPHSEEAALALGTLKCAITAR